MTPHPVAVGDLHGRSDLLDLLLAAYPERHFVFLGDYVDRGPDSPGVLARVRSLVERGRAVALMGNHDLWMMETLLGGHDPADWLRNGGDATLRGYQALGDVQGREAAVRDALWMNEYLKPWHTFKNVLYSHAMRPDPAGLDAQAHLWGRPGSTTPFYPLPDGVVHSVHGHTPHHLPTAFGQPDETLAWFIDTGAVFTGTLCALDTRTWAPRLFSMT